MLRGVGEAIVGFMIMIAVIAFLAGGFFGVVHTIKDMKNGKLVLL